MTAKIVNLPVVTTLDLPPDRILDAAKEADLGSVVVVGHTKDGHLYFAGSMADGGEVLWLFERAKLALMGAIE